MKLTYILKTAPRTAVLCVTLFWAVGAAGETYQYDDVGRLVNVEYDDGSSIAYSYDNAGNIPNVVTQWPVTLSLFAADFGKTEFFGSSADLDVDGDVDGKDLHSLVTTVCASECL